MTFHGVRQGKFSLHKSECISDHSLILRKVEGEGKGEGHGAGGGRSNLPEVPLRRWEDWERSRLRKLRREERRRREFERSHPSGYIAGDGELLSVRGVDARSQYDGSDTFSLNSSDDDHWGPQIGGYNEHHAQYPLPPVGLILPQDETLHSAKTVDGAELEAMLETGFNDRPTPPSSTYAPRYQLSDGSTTQLANVNGSGYAPLTRSTSPGFGPPPSTAISPSSPTMNMSGDPPRGTSGRGGSGERYGPLGPLDPATRF
jgi:chitin synthase